MVRKQKQRAKSLRPETNQGLENAFIVKDDIETGYLNTIPLWQFGLTY